ncbi:MAG: hypothetical protein ACR2H3_12755 [Acidimicrobiales bacterium]
MRQLLAAIAAAAASAFAAIILGEYELVGWIPLAAGLVFGIGTAEVVATIARWSDIAIVAATGLIAEGGMVWAVWISSGRGIVPVAVTAWVGCVLAGLVAAGWVRFALGRGDDSPTGA